MIATTWGVGQVFLAFLWFFLLFIELWLMLMIFVDLFRSDDLRGWAKALWVIFILIVPLVGVLAYLVVRGDKMRLHQIRWMQQQEEAFRQYVLRVIGSRNGHSTHVSEMAELARLMDRGLLTPEEFQVLKDELVAS